MGAPPDYAGEGTDNNWARPLEDPDVMGCPGSWYRTPFIQSLLEYYRERDDQGNRVPNPKLDRCDDPLVHEAIVLLERHEGNAIREHLYQISLRAKGGGDG